MLSSVDTSTYDFCMVCPVEYGESGGLNFTERSKGHMNKLKKLGFELYACEFKKTGAGDDAIIVLVRTPLERLRHFADSIVYKMKLDAEVIKDMLEKGDPEADIGPIVIPHRPDITKLEPFEHIFTNYSKEVPESIYYRKEGEQHPFNDAHRLKLASLILESRTRDSGENLKIRRYLRAGFLLGCFPLHNREQSAALFAKWNRFPFGFLPLFDFQLYFGQKLAFYFAFLQHFIVCLAIPAVIGVPLQISILSTGDFSATYLPLFSFFITLWCVGMLETWKRQEKSIALEWGSIHFEQREVDRPDFKGEWIDSFIDGSKVRYFSSTTRAWYIGQSLLVLLVLVVLIIGVVASIYALRFHLTKSIGSSAAGIVASILSAVQIQVLNYFYTFIATIMSERENHRTSTQFEDSMIMKMFQFQFVNSYASFVYLAFIAETMGDCEGDGCMQSLAVNLAIIFGSRLLVGNMTEVAMPYYFHNRMLKKEAKENPKFDSYTDVEKEFLYLDKYDQLSKSLEEYTEVAITYGYMALFISALPIAAIFAMVSMIVEVRFDGWKLVNLYQRPFPKDCEDIGTWQDIFLMIAMVAVVTNAGLICFTMDYLDEYSLRTRFWVFIAFQWFCLICQMIVMRIFDDVPEEVQLQLRRIDFISRKLIDKVADGHQESLVVDGSELQIHREEEVENNPSAVDKPIRGGDPYHLLHDQEHVPPIPPPPALSTAADSTGVDTGGSTQGSPTSAAARDGGRTFRSPKQLPSPAAPTASTPSDSPGKSDKRRIRRKASDHELDPGDIVSPPSPPPL